MGNNVAEHAASLFTYMPVIKDFDYAFAENGLTAYKMGKPLPSQSFINFIGEEKYKLLVNFILHQLADIDIPIKRWVSSSLAQQNFEPVPLEGLS